MNIGFFADDKSAAHAALLADSAFNRDLPCDPGIISGTGRIADAVQDFLDAARLDGRHLMVALPLDHLNDPAIRNRLDLAVVCAGPNPVDHAAARRMLSFDAARSASRLPPAWMLAATDRRDGSPLRRLPVAMTPLRLQEARSLRAGCTCGTLRRRGIALAAALHIAADDPYADAIDPEEVAELLIPNGRHAAPPSLSGRLRRELVDLAADLDDIPWGCRTTWVRRRKPDTSRNKVRRCGPRAVTQGRPFRPRRDERADCACVRTMREGAR